ncbi:MAG: amidohydrolase family protein [Acidisphaera sp.]|nr:amidohydrolase family protein [Acidisphaera sp.]MBV9811577.1 amidohydrolase family protein [Acetobacteraceae bacterium]
MANKIPGPDRLTRRPRFSPPPGACDAHCHVFGPATKFPYDPEASYRPPDSSFEDMRVLHTVLGIERAVIVHPSCHGTDMRATLDAIARSGGRYRGTAVLDEDCSDAELLRLHAGGIRGVRFNFVRHLGGRPDPLFFQRTMERVRPLGWHLVLHLDAHDIAEFAEAFRRIPLPLVIDHMGRITASEGLGQQPFQVLLEFLRSDHVWVKISGPERVDPNPPFTGAVPFAHALAEAAPERVLWGTDWPHPNVRHMPNDGDLVDLLPQMLPTKELQRKVLVENPGRLYGFEGVPP